MTALRHFRCQAAAFAAIAWLLGGCAGALDLVASEPPRLFELTPKSTFDDNLPKAEARIDIEVPSATAGLNTAKIALKPTATRFEYYARARWVDVVPIMVQTLLLESFNNSERIDVLGRGSYGLRADYGLLTTIREFQAVYDGDEDPPTAVVRLQTRLVRLPKRETVGSMSAASEVKAASTKLQDIITAFDEAFGKAAKDLVQWTVRTTGVDEPV